MATSLPDAHRSLLGRVIAFLRNGESVALLAPRRSGKTTFLGHLRTELDRHANVQVVTYDLRRPRATWDVLRRLALCRGGAEERQALLTRAGLTTTRPGVRPVVLMDSVENEDTRWLHRLMQVLRGSLNELLFEGLPCFSVLLAGTDEIGECIVAPHSPFHFARRLTLPNLDLDETAALVRNTLGAGVPDHIVRMVFDHTSGDPSLTRFLASLLAGGDDDDDAISHLRFAEVRAAIRDAVRHHGRHRRLKETVDRVGRDPDLLDAVRQLLRRKLAPEGPALALLTALGVVQEMDDEVVWRCRLWKRVFKHVTRSGGLDGRHLALLRLNRRCDEMQSEREVTRRIHEAIARDPLPSLDDLLDRILTATRRLVPFDAGVVFLRQGEVLRPRRSLGYRSPRAKGPPPRVLSRGEPFAGWILDDGRPRLVGDVLEEPAVARLNTDIGQGRSFRAYLGVPVQLGESMEGVLDVVAELPYTFDVSHRERLQHIANSVAIAIARTRGFEQTGILTRLSRELPAAESPGQVLQTAATCVRELTGAERASAWYATREGRIDVVAPPGASRDWVPKDPTVVPLCVDGRMLGELRAESRARGDFGPEAEQVAASVGREVAAAMERLRLSRQQRHRQQVLDELGELSVEASDTGSFLDAVVQRVAKELSIEVAAVFWFEPRDDMLRRVAVHPRHIEEWKEEHYAVYPEGIALHGESLVGRVFAGGKTIRVDDVEADPRLHMPSIERLRAFLTRRRFAHFLGVPMRFQDRMRGVFRVLNKLDRSGNLDPEGLTAEDAEWLAILANHAAFVMVTMERQARQDAFREYSKEVLAEAELDRVGQLTVDLLTSDALRYRGAALWVTQDTGEKVELVPWYEKGLVSGKGGRAQGLEAPRWRSGQKARVTRDIAPGERMGEGLREVALRAGLGTAFCIPIRVGRTQLGVLTVFGGPAYTFSHDERSFLTTAAHHVAAAVDRVERLEAERRRTQAEAVMMGAADERDLLRSVAHHAPEIVEAESALVWAPRPEGEQVSLICEASSPGTVAPDSTRLFAELCLRGRRAFGPVHQGHIERHRCWREGDAAGPAPRSLLLVPVVDDEGSVLAVLELRNKTGRQPTSGFTPEDRRRAERLADKLPTRIGLLRMHAKLQRENEQRRMLRELAHNIRSPLISIRHLTRFLLDGLVEEDAERDDFLSTIHTENERFIRLLTDLLETWRIEAGQDRYDIQPVDIGDIARQALAASRYLLLEADLHCETRIAAGPLMAMADPDRCRYLLQLLLDNAIKYSPPGRRIGLQAGRRGSMIRLVVRDKGPGIPKRERRDLFTPFVRGAGVGGKDGLGLGMHLVKRYVDAMGGRLRVWSKTDSGTTVTVLLPAAPGGTEDA